MSQRLLTFWFDRDTEGCTYAWDMQVGQKKGISLRIQWRSFQPDEGGVPPWMLFIHLFWWGSFLGFSPNGDYRRWPFNLGWCCSNGVTLFSWSPIEPFRIRRSVA